MSCSTRRLLILQAYAASPKPTGYSCRLVLGMPIRYSRASEAWMKRGCYGWRWPACRISPRRKNVGCWFRKDVFHDDRPPAVTLAVAAVNPNHRGLAIAVMIRGIIKEVLARSGFTIKESSAPCCCKSAATKTAISTCAMLTYNWKVFCVRRGKTPRMFEEIGHENRFASPARSYSSRSRNPRALPAPARWSGKADDRVPLPGTRRVSW